MNNADIERRHAVVTGGGSGIGLAIASALARCGATLTIMGRNVETLTNRARELSATAVPVDVTDSQSVQSAFEQAASANGAVSILINNAGGVQSGPFRKLDDDGWQRTLNLNLSGVFRCSRAVAPQMLDAGYGRIVNIASTAALKGYAYVSAYCAAKHGVVGLTRALATEFAQSGVTVNAVCPGYTDTDIVSSAIQKIVDATGRSEPEALAELVSANPQGRLINPKEVAETVLWLLGEGSASITGQSIAVAGGEVM